MYRSTVVAFFLLALMGALPVASKDVGHNDIPTACITVCSNLAEVTKDCYRAFKNDSLNVNCICHAANAQTVIPLCAACVGHHGSNNNDTGNNNTGNNEAGKNDTVTIETGPANANDTETGTSRQDIQQNENGTRTAMAFNIVILAPKMLSAMADSWTDISDLLQSCSFSSTVYDASKTYSVAALTAATNATAITTGTGTVAKSVANRLRFGCY